MEDNPQAEDNFGAENNPAPENESVLEDKEGPKVKALSEDKTEHEDDKVSEDRAGLENNTGMEDNSVLEDNSDAEPAETQTILKCQRRVTNGQDYRGRMSKSKTGKQCRPWSETTHGKKVLGTQVKLPPHAHSNMARKNPEGQSFCRNPDNEKRYDGGVWCYVKNPDKQSKGTDSGNGKWEHCRVPWCNRFIDHPRRRGCKGCNGHCVNGQCIRAPRANRRIMPENRMMRKNHNQRIRLPKNSNPLNRQNMLENRHFSNRHRPS